MRSAIAYALSLTDCLVESSRKTEEKIKNQKMREVIAQSADRVVEWGSEFAGRCKMLDTMPKSKKNVPGGDEPPKKPVYPSRLNTKYIAVPKHYFDALAEYARDHSDADDEKSISWACRVAIRRMMEAEGIKLRPMGEGEE